MSVFIGVLSNWETDKICRISYKSRLIFSSFFKIATKGTVAKLNFLKS